VRSVETALLVEDGLRRRGEDALTETRDDMDDGVLERAVGSRDDGLGKGSAGAPS